MDIFHKANQKRADGTDYTANRYYKRGKRDGQYLRKLARSKLKKELEKEQRGYNNEN